MKLTSFIASTSLAVLVAVGLVAPSAAQGASVAQVDDLPGIDVGFTRVTPLNPTAKRTLRLEGTVTNRSDSVINTISINLNVGTAPVSSPESVNQIDAGEVQPQSRQLPNGNLTLSLENTGGLTPGSTAPWTYSAAFADIGLQSQGVYTIRASAFNTEDNNLNGFNQTFIPWFSEPATTNPVNVLFYWPLASPPNRAADNTLMNESTVQSMAPGGRLHSLLNIPRASSAASWVVDPSLPQTANSISNGYFYFDEQGNAVEGSGGSTAAQWLANAKQTLAEAQVNSMPYGFSDTPALITNNLAADATLAMRIASSTLNQSLAIGNKETIGWIPGPQADPQVVELTRNAGIQQIVVPLTEFSNSEEVVRPRNPVGTIKTDGGSITTLLSDPLTSEAVSQAATTPQDEIKLRQRILALIGTWPNGLNQKTALVIAPPTYWHPNAKVLEEVLRGVSGSTWAKTVSQSQLLAESTEAELDSLQATSEDRAAGTAESARLYFQSIRRQHRKLLRFSSVIADSADVTNPFRTALLRAESGGWRRNREQGRQLMTTIAGQIDQSMNQVRAVSSNVVNLSNETGSIPITLINEFDHPATVQIRLDATPSVRLKAPEATTFTIPAGRKISTELAIEVAGSDELPVSLQLLTPEGQRWGQAQQISVRNSAYARAATYVVVAAFVLLAGLLTVNSIRRRRAGPEDEDLDGGDLDAGDTGVDEDDGKVQQLDKWRNPSE